MMNTSDNNEYLAYSDGACEDRPSYLALLATSYNLPEKDVVEVASELGPYEDFDRLPSYLELFSKKGVPTDLEHLSETNIMSPYYDA